MKLLKKICLSKLAKQGGRCFYCELPMWVQGNEDKEEASGNPWQLQCTAEHLTARCEGGLNSRNNIVAACRFCNSRRHRSKNPRSAELHRAFVKRRMAAGRWLTGLVDCSD